jgi:hypothetical protein
MGGWDPDSLVAVVVVTKLGRVAAVDHDPYSVEFPVE